MTEDLSKSHPNSPKLILMAEITPAEFKARIDSMDLNDTPGKLNAPGSYGYAAATAVICENAFFEPLISEIQSMADQISSSLLCNRRLTSEEMSNLAAVWSVAQWGRNAGPRGYPGTLYTSADQLYALQYLYRSTSITVLTAAAILSFPNHEKLIEVSETSMEWRTFLAVARVKWNDENVPMKGVTLRDAALLLNDGDGGLATVTIERWRNSRAPELPSSIGKCPDHSQRDIFPLQTLRAFLDIMEPGKITPDFVRNLSTKLRQPRNSPTQTDCKPTAPTAKTKRKKSQKPRKA